MSTSVAMAPNDQQSRRGILELAGHPTRYTQTKVKGIRKKKKAKPVQKEKDINDSTKKPYHPPKKLDGVPVASKRRSRMAIGQLKIINAQDRVQQLIKLAEDGRRKSNTLPPLEREASFARQPRKTSNSNNKNGQSGKDVEEKPVRKVSVKMDRKIVSHLKHHLNKRLQKRFDQQDEPLEYPSDEEEREGRKSRGRDLQGSGQGEKGIFANYSETGEKIQETDGRKRRGKMAKSPSRPAMNHRGSTSSVSLSTSGMSGAEDGRNDENMLNASFKKSSPLPGIPSGQVQSADVDANTATEGTESTNHVDDQEDAFLPSPEDCTEVEDIDFWLTDVSPVQTPMASRPSSCASNGPLSRWERALEILSGTVHKPSPPNRAVINLYVASGYSDTDAERVFMQEHLYPGLRALCMHQGHELRVHDLHWGFKDAISDDHRLPEIMHNVIKEIQKSLFGLNFLIILGQKLGPCLLPTWIQQGELEAIASLASKSADQQRAELKARIAQVEATRKEREAKTKLEGGAQTSTENTLSAGRLADDQLDSARTDVTREGQEEIQVTAAEQRRAINLASKKELQELKVCITALHFEFVLYDKVAP
ncbi:NACHT and WD repeat domain-containing protein 1 [Plakobranchus ocellatus]|uniref:NACHT and WD repeat domain-containing protein 1 n=1 Tax=Plakobranchus ocellatus TaxID=259542 RepID=A0AAV4DCA2_9GAST|nr:NACHT and WD repeat domain-containing protein 1 [Plakobranchus ocellatus]